ncbi:MAG: imelysin family protein [Bacteroidota bacterium]|nr:imelysin family protein [Bacteroidota bacterium]
MKKYLYIITLYAIFISVSCNKKPVVTEPDVNKVTSSILNDFPTHIAEPILLDLSNKANDLKNAIQTFVITSTDANLLAAQQSWYGTRQIWEQSESFLFGPVADKGLDPSIDDWPISYTEIDSVLKSSNVFSATYIQGLNTTLKGFHPIEYMLFGFGGNRKANELTSREKDYLLALAENLKLVTTQMYTEWQAQGSNFSLQVKSAGTVNSKYKTRKEALLEIANAMIGIIGEVGEAKIGEPYTAMDSMLEESPFSGNSWKDFAMNIKGAKNVYLCNYSGNGSGLHALTELYNKSLDLKITQKMDAAYSNLNAYSTKFGKAIYNERPAVESTVQLLADLKNILENELIPLIQTYVKN